MSETVRVGTRASELAQRQTGLVVRALARRHPQVRFEVVPLRTQGDRIRRPASGLDFTDAIDRALEGERIDLAIHSSKDLPVVPTRAVRIAAFPRRADPRDGLVLRVARDLATLPTGARIGSSSPRRRSQLLRARPDLAIVAIRGNVDTRLELVRSGRVDGVVLALAGLERLGRQSEVTEILDRRRFLPAPGQGALAVAVRKGDRRLARLAAGLDHPATRAAVTAERAFVHAVGGDCDTPLGALATVSGDVLSMRAEILSADGRTSIAAARSGPAQRPADLGRALARDLVRAGGAALLPSGRVRGRSR